MATAEAIHTFWFEGVEWGAPASDPMRSGRPTEAAFARWFQGGPEFDAAIRAAFAPDVEQALAGQLDGWADQAMGRVSLVLLLDQFTRNVFRDQARAFAGDAAAQQFAARWVNDGRADRARPIERYFLYMPFMHAEDLALQRRGVELFRQLEDAAPAGTKPFFENATRFAERHLEAIKRFGRFPARNTALGRVSTPEEETYLTEHPSGF